MDSLFDLPEELTEAPDVAGSSEAPLYPPPDRACLVCGKQKWKWKPEMRMYACGGSQVAHEECTAWHRVTFSWLAQV